MKKKLVAVVCLVALLLSMTTLGTLSASAETNPWINYTAPSDIEYSFLVLGDIQSLTYMDAKGGSKHVKAIFDWILENRDEKKIEYIFGLGDTIDAPWETGVSEWALVSPLFKSLNGIIPYSVVRGNHDDYAGYEYFICTDAYKSQMNGFLFDSTKSAGDGNTHSNSYRTFEAGNNKYLFVTLDYGANDDVLEWANGIISRYPDHRVIVSTHGYIYYNGDLLDDENTSFGTPMTNTGEEMWNKCFSLHDNMFMVLCGHVGIYDPVVRTRKSDSGHQIFEVLVDPQGYDVGTEPGGFVLMLNFLNNGNRINFEYYSTIKGMHFKESNQFTRTVPGVSMLVLQSTTEATTATPTTAEATTVADDETESGCGSAITSTLFAACTIGTSLAAFAMRKKKEN